MTKDTVAVLRMKDRKLMTQDKKSIIGQKQETDISLPRWRRNIDVSLKEDQITLADGKHDNVLATVDLWRLGIGYNVNRMLGNNQKLYIVTR
ncbi:hypothetical protein F4821DRAFT_189349 [Hypoxylon rubiginosum]|uniref:Uncharacterized protein n=1 Tax=Hypoxylon rubiginosum TaxID=110542 RepID=A0ACC0DG15_9PEZI|nr:hypothetical protein F4821DRAFT_189349 [Hypoxylon rubiginosum]